MRLSRLLFAPCVLLVGTLAAGSVQAQGKNEDKPFDYKQFIPPALPLFPPNSEINSGTVGGTSDPYTTAPLQSPSPSSIAPAPGFKLTVPAR